MVHASVVERLIKAGADVNAADADSRTALAVAALGPVESAENRGRVVSLLIDAGAEVDHRDRDLMTPLLVASYEGHCTFIIVIFFAKNPSTAELMKT